jgi:hypothetical protein
MRYAMITLALCVACSDRLPDEAAVPAAQAYEPQFTSIESFESAAVKKDVPYVPTPNETVLKMLQLADVSRNDVVYDLGSGDGRIVITAAKNHGARGVGIDIDPQRIEEANENAKAAGVTDRVRFIQGDLFQADIKEATAVTLYLLRSVNLKLRPKLLSDLRPGTPVVSHDFDMGEWEPDAYERVGDDDVYLWIIPAKIDGQWRWTGGDGKVRRATFEQSFQKLSGRVEAGGQRFNIRNGRIKGEEVSFEIARAGDETAPVAERYTGKFTNGKLQGRIEANGRRSQWLAQHE